VYINDEIWHEKTPTKIPRQKLGESCTLKFKRNGYRVQKKQISADIQGDLNVPLRKKPTRGNNKPEIEE
jgi:hypothetical protein